MTTYEAGSYQVAVIGAGHAGIEAALACARLGLSTVLFTINLDAVGNMPCNPAIGGTGKGHLVRELDALGGQMGIAADAACIQYRMLNRGKGPAVHSLRAQADRRKYQEYMKNTLELQENLELKQAMIVKVLTEDGKVTGVVTQLGAVYKAQAVILATGTYLDSTVITGESVQPAGPDGMHASQGLSENLKALGVRPPGSTAGALTFPKWSFSRETRTPSPSPFQQTTPYTIRRCATLPIPTQKPTGLSGRIWTEARCMTAPSPGWGPGTAPASKPSWCGFLIRSGISCSSSPAA